MQQGYDTTWAFVDDNLLLYRVGKGELMIDEALAMLPALSWKTA